MPTANSLAPALGETSSALLFFLYGASYLLVSACFAVALCATAFFSKSDGRFSSWAGSFAGFYFRTYLVMVLGCFAGLPPFFFFGPKLGLLAAVISQGGLGAVCAVLFLVFAGWYAYFCAVRQLLTASAFFAAEPRRFFKLAGPASLCLVTLVAALCFLALALDDFHLVVAWVVA